RLVRRRRGRQGMGGEGAQQQPQRHSNSENRDDDDEFGPTPPSRRGLAGIFDIDHLRIHYLPPLVPVLRLAFCVRESICSAASPQKSERVALKAASSTGVSSCPMPMNRSSVASASSRKARRNASSVMSRPIRISTLRCATSTLPFDARQFAASMPTGFQA